MTGFCHSSQRAWRLCEAEAEYITHWRSLKGVPLCRELRKVWAAGGCCQVGCQYLILVGGNWQQMENTTFGNHLRNQIWAHDLTAQSCFPEMAQAPKLASLAIGLLVPFPVYLSLLGERTAASPS